MAKMMLPDIRYPVFRYPAKQTWAPYEYRKSRIYELRRSVINETATLPIREGMKPEDMAAVLGEGAFSLLSQRGIIDIKAMHIDKDELNGYLKDYNNRKILLEGEFSPRKKGRFERWNFRGGIIGRLIERSSVYLTPDIDKFTCLLDFCSKNRFGRETAIDIFEFETTEAEFRKDVISITGILSSRLIEELQTDTYNQLLRKPLREAKIFRLAIACYGSPYYLKKADSLIIKEELSIAARTAELNAAIKSAENSKRMSDAAIYAGEESRLMNEIISAGEKYWSWGDF